MLTLMAIIAYPSDFSTTIYPTANRFPVQARGYFDLGELPCKS